MQYWVKFSNFYQEGKFQYYDNISVIVKKINTYNVYTQDLNQKLIRGVMFNEPLIIKGLVIEIKKYIYKGDCI